MRSGVRDFINGELYGRMTSVPWGMYFPLDETRQLRHPSQLYEMFFEGIFLFAIFGRFETSRGQGRLLPIYLIGYGSVRFCIEFFREPDAHLGYLFGIARWGRFYAR